MDTFAVDGVDLSTILENVGGFVFRNCDHRALILSEVLVNEINVSYFFTW